jgi:uncharacterized protein (TIGR02246 family)
MQESNIESTVRALYRQLLDCWNQHSATRFAALFTEDGTIIGFDGSIHNGREKIQSNLSEVFKHHETPSYVGIVRTVRCIGKDTAYLTAVCGMVPRGETDINSDLNAIQALLAVSNNGDWRIAAFQNTPAAFHGRADLRQQLTQELRGKLPPPSAFA